MRVKALNDQVLKLKKLRRLTKNMPTISNQFRRKKQGKAKSQKNALSPVKNFPHRAFFDVRWKFNAQSFI